MFRNTEQLLEQMIHILQGQIFFLYQIFLLNNFQMLLLSLNSSKSIFYDLVTTPKLREFQIYFSTSPAKELNFVNFDFSMFSNFFSYFYMNKNIDVPLPSLECMCTQGQYDRYKHC